jgi:hypothetical protein
MANQRVAISALFGGVSTQPAALRHANQVAAADNVYFSVRDDAEKRPGLEHIFSITDLEVGENYRLHAIDRDGTERYLIVYGAGTLRAFNPEDGTEYVVTPTEEAAAYLALESPDCDDLRLITIADYTLIVNTLVSVADLTSADYTLTGTFHDYEAMTATRPTNATYWKTDVSSVRTSGYWYYNSGGASYASMKMKAMSTTNGQVSYFTTAGHYPGGFKVAFQRQNMDITGGVFDHVAKTLTKVGAFTNYVWRLGDQLKMTGGTAITLQWADIASRESDDVVVMEADLTTNASDPTNVATDAIGREYEVIVADFSACADMDDVAQTFQDALQDAGAADGLISWARTSTGGQFVISSPYYGNEAKVFPTTAPDSGFNYAADNLHFSGVAGDYVQVAGSGTSGAVPNSLLESWTRVSAPNQPHAAPDKDTMPVKLVRGFEGPDPSTPTFAVDVIEWHFRETGDEYTNKIPSIWDKSLEIKDISLHRNRLMLCAGENIVMSQASDLFNFFLEDSENIGDSDPIDVALSTDRVTLIDYISPFRKTMVIFTMAGQQFELNAPETLTPTTVAITPSTRYNSMTSVRPGVQGIQLYFVSTAEQGAQVREYAYNYTYDTNLATDISSHVVGYLPMVVTSLSVVPNYDVLFLAERDSGYIYRYRSYVQNDQKVQSAWSRVILPAGMTVKDAVTLGNYLYVLVTLNGTHQVLRLCSDQPTIPDGMPFMPRMDNWELVEGTNDGEYTTWTLDGEDNNRSVAVLGPDFGEKAGYSVAVERVDANTVRVADSTGLYAGYGCYIGTPFLFDTELSRPFVRDQQGAAILDANLLLQTLSLEHVNSGSYSVTVHTEGFPDWVETFTPPTGLIEVQGENKFQIRGYAETTTVHVTSSSVAPLVLVCGEWIATFQPRSMKNG